MSKKTRIKAATLEAPQSREETQSWIKELGDVQREAARQTAAMNDEIGMITERYKDPLNTLTDRAKALQTGIQAWCEAHRTELTGKGKTANLVTGEVSWRQRPPSIVIRGAESVLEALRSLGLQRFIRTKDEVNKDAMLNEPELAATVAGVSVRKGAEDFVIKPFEQTGETA
jgi:bacteriophage Mu gam like protein